MSPEPPGKSVVLVTRERSVPSPFREALESAGYRVVAVEGCERAWKAIQETTSSLVLVDADPLEDADLDFCSRVRASPATSLIPVILLVDGTRPEQKEKGFAAKADACLERPVEPRALLLWVSTLLRRVEYGDREGGVLRAEDLSLDPKTKTVTVGDRVIRDLTDKEFGLLYELVLRRPKILSKQYILGTLWRAVLRDNTVEVHVRNLRLKLGPAASRIVTVPKAGYRFR